MLTMKTKCQEAFELRALTWGLDYSMDSLGRYLNLQTANSYVTFEQGWDAAMDFMGQE